MSAQHNQVERGDNSLLMGEEAGDDDDSDDEDEEDEIGEVNEQGENEGK